MPTREAPPRASLGATRIRLIESLSEAAAVSALWEALPGALDEPTACPDWSLAAAEAFGLEGRLRLAALESGGTLLAIAPLARGRGPLAPWEPIGASRLGEPARFPAGSAAAAIRLAQALALRGVGLLLPRVPAEAPAAEAVARAYRTRGFVLRREAPPSPFIALDETWLRPEERLDADRRSSLRRAVRLAGGPAAVAVRTFAPSPAEVPALLDEAYRIEAAGWKGRQGTALACDAPMGSFFRAFACAASRRGWLRLSLLLIAGQAAAAEIAVRMGGSHWILKTGYDEAFRRFSPGHLLILGTLRRAAEEGARTYEFLGGDEPWVRAYTLLARRCVSLRAHPRTLAGAIWLAGSSVAWTWRRAAAAARTL
ncbi:MAG TPA: GNAT family N-acetyltransferase [Candidatus Polarisedimenticolia bacterium]|nr:GNAT family N-acetyltransferase [Candidatus Polarisedimenticolia bacterium]